MEVIKQFINAGETAGLVFIAIGIIVGVFKQYWLIAGVNTASKKELEKIDTEYVGKYFGIFTGVFGITLFFTPFILRRLDLMKYYHYFKIIEILVFVVFMFLYGHLKKDRIYKKNSSVKRTDNGKFINC